MTSARTTAKLVWRMRADGRSYDEIAAYLRDQGTPHPKERDWTGADALALLIEEFGEVPSVDETSDQNR
ncbi:hypothetical protein HNR42_003308 [Deinobacterium chartae]|uniref:Recombinase domain-containing protein n=1 Tax=Deinobacterium chartae TaxID=521158 RepID=A0A841I5W5_9DEIO|nr:recombinase family protein [Deinobacterium chartae]MBB6099848.1 hypothetical protein [Deinobacterium chartae]